MIPPVSSQHVGVLEPRYFQEKQIRSMHSWKRRLLDASEANLNVGDVTEV